MCCLAKFERGKRVDFPEVSVVNTLRQSNIAMENGPFEDVSPIKNGGFPLLC